jgi:chromosome partitioning protein
MAVKIVALVSTKGGSGKSTLAACLAVEAVQDGQTVLLLDIDPQQSTTNWWKRRKGPTNPMLVTGVSSTTHAVQEITKRKQDRDILIVDCPGSFMNVLKDAVQTADCLVVVTRASAKDFEGIAAAEELIAKAGRKDRTIYAINAVNRRSKLGSFAIDIVASRSPNPPVTITDLTAFVYADAKGETANEINDVAAQEIGALWQEVKGVINAKR